MKKLHTKKIRYCPICGNEYLAVRVDDVMVCDCCSTNFEVNVDDQEGKI